MAFRVLVHAEVQKFLKTLPGDRQAKIRKALDALTEDPSTPRPTVDIRRLRGPPGRRDAFRLRVGDYRLLYDVEGENVWVTEAWHRGRGYR